MNSEPSETDFRDVRSVLAGIVILGAVLLLVAVCAYPFALERYGSGGIVAVFVAAATCWISASCALAITVVTSHGPQAVAGLFLAIAVRMGAPLAAGIAWTIAGSRLAEAGLFGLILIHYFVALVVETTIAVYLVSARSRVTQ